MRQRARTPRDRREELLMHVHVRRRRRRSIGLEIRHRRLGVSAYNMFPNVVSSSCIQWTLTSRVPTLENRLYVRGTMYVLEVQDGGNALGDEGRKADRGAPGVIRLGGANERKIGVQP